MSGESQRDAFGWRFGSNQKNAKIAPSQIATRLQRKIPTAGLRARWKRSSRRVTTSGRSL